MPDRGVPRSVEIVSRNYDLAAKRLDRGIEDRIWVRIGDQPPIPGIADEDMVRSNDAKTSAVHFLRFELPPAAVQALRAGAGVSAGIDHPELPVTVPALPCILCESLIADLA